MINLHNAQITDILPANLTQTADVKALSYSVMTAMKKLLSYATKTIIYSDIDNLSNEILDVLAVELRSQYYNEGLDLDTKRKVIKETIQLYSIAGTPLAVEKLISSVFKTGEVIEWYQYSGEPGHFKITTENYNVTGDLLQKFNLIIEHVKRKSSILDAVEITLSAYMNIYNGAVLHTGDTILMKQEG